MFSARSEGEGEHADGAFFRGQGIVLASSSKLNSEPPHNPERATSGRGLGGRVRPGLLNSYFFYGFMARHVEMWRPVIEGARAGRTDRAR